MYNLIIKDILVQKKSLLFALGYCFFLVFAFQSLEGVTPIAASTVVVYFLIQNSFAYEDKNKSEIIINSLPISRKEIVLAKYLSIFVYIGLAIVAYMIATLTVKVVRVPVKVEFPDLKDVTITLLLVSLMNSIYMPIIFRIGYLKAKIFNMVMFLLFFFIPMGVASLYENPKYSAGISDITGIISSFSDWQIAALLAAISLMLLFFSYSISLGIYKNREF
ncbi:MAG TPA: ABC-2 transporter permease [Clostridia bacterium]|nr:ABC-2 transporter permease [Clostridia bacterium]